jgi:ubiquinone/menaquinone biosynthesis C-methylase UbiE
MDFSLLTRETDEDLGLGIPYERWSISQLMEKLYFINDFSTVLEGPGDGMAGIKGLNSITFAQRNCKVTVSLPAERQIEIARSIYEKHNLNATFNKAENFQLDYKDQSFDLVWNFCITHILNSEKLIDDMVRISRKYVMIIVPNLLNYGFLLHKIDHILTGEPWIHGNINYMNTQKIRSALEKRGLKVKQTFLVDVPFWPDIDKPLETVIGNLLPPLRKWLNRRAEKRYKTYSYKADNLPYFSNDLNFEKLMYKLSFIERNFPDFIKILFAHHNGVIAQK